MDWEGIRREARRRTNPHPNEGGEGGKPEGSEGESVGRKPGNGMTNERIGT